MTARAREALAAKLTAAADELKAAGKTNLRIDIRRDGARVPTGWTTFVATDPHVLI